jgi:predicted GTPase
MSTDHPTFAVVGAVNHGKSSVVSTLSENDEVRISPVPGETTESRRFSLRDLFSFYDTPGFQNAPEALTELLPAEHTSTPLQVFRDFLQRHRGDSAFDAECRLFAPIVDGAGLIYVVDGSRPALDLNLAEMRILRLTGQPRLAIINRTSADNFVADWKARLGQNFNSVREFNAHHATFADRIELLETLAGIEQSWKPKLARAVTLLREEWDSRLNECAEIIVELLVAALRHRETSSSHADLDTRRASVGEDLKARYKLNVSRLESRAHARIITLFRHHLVKTESREDHLFAEDLFSDETWKLFGLETTQLVTLATMSGAAVGVGIDALTLGHSFGLFALAGGALGAGSSLVIGRQRPELSVSFPRDVTWLPKGLADLLPGKLQFSGRALAVGPYRALNFPWILLDRAIGTFCYVINRAHARRDEVTLRSIELHDALAAHGLTTAQWTDAARKPCEQLFQAIRRNKFQPPQRAELRTLLAEHLREISNVRVDFRTTPRG